MGPSSPATWLSMCFTNMAQLGSESRHTNWTLCKVYINRQHLCPTGMAPPTPLPFPFPLSATGATYRGGRKVLRLGAPLGSNGRQCWYTAGVGGEPARQLGLGPVSSRRRRKGTHLGLAPRALLVSEEIVHLVSLDRLGYSVPFFPATTTAMTTATTAIHFRTRIGECELGEMSPGLYVLHGRDEVSDLAPEERRTTCGKRN